MTQVHPLSLSAAMAAALVVGGATHAGAQTADVAASVAVTSNLSASRWVAATDPIEIVVARTAAAARTAIFIGDTDWTSLFAAREGTFVLRPTTLALPRGEHTVIVYSVSPDNVWEEQARFPIRVRARGGFETATATPAIDVGFKSQLAEGHEPEGAAPARPTFRDLTLQVGFASRLSRGGVTWQQSINLVGASFKGDALRFGERGQDALPVDLSGYLVQVERARARVSLGHIAFGGSRHLINNFGSRGVSFAAPLGARGDVSATLQHGTAIVGWNQILGITRRQHRIAAASAGVELAGSRPGGLRLEGTVLTGSLLPETGVNQSAITDAETSQGVSGRVIASDARQRVRLDSGYTRSRFTNPLDPLLAQDTDIVAVRETARAARYVDVTVDVVQNAALTATEKATVSLAFKHERVDPLFRSVAAPAQADLRQNQIEVLGALGTIALQFTHTQLRDNLEDIPSILTTLTRRNAASAIVPTAMFTGAPATTVWAPKITITIDQTHQFGASLPVNSDLNETHVPDQQSVSEVVGVEWQLPRWRAGYRLSGSTQDNRQVGRENADLSALSHAIALGLSPGTRLDLGIDLSLDQAQNKEEPRTDRTRRLAVQGDWRVTAQVGATGHLSVTWTGDDARTTASRNIELDLEAHWQIALARQPRQKPAARAFLRYAHQLGELENRLFGVARTTRAGWTVNTGISITLF